MAKEAIQIYLFVISLVLVVLSVATLLILIYSLSKENASETQNRRVGPRRRKQILKKKQYPTIGSAFFESWACFLFIGVIVELEPHSNENFSSNTDFLILMVFFGVFIFLSKLSLYLQFLVRLYNTFKGSALHINTSTIIASTILFIASIIFMIWWIIVMVLKNVAKLDMGNSYYPQLLCILVSLVIINHFLSVMVVTLFTRKLFRFLLFKDRSMFLRMAEKKLKFEDAQNLVADHTDIDHTDDEDVNIELDEKKLPKLEDVPTIKKTYSFVLDIVGAGIDNNDMKTLDLITKQFILSISSIVITQFVYLTLIFVVIFRNYWNEHYIWVYWLFLGVYYPLDVIINCIVLYFNYKFAIKYYQCCCKICHRRCKDCAIKHAAKKIYKQHYDELNLKNDR